MPTTQLSPNSALGALLPQLLGSLVCLLFNLSLSCPRAQRTSAPVPMSAEVPAKKGQMERPKIKVIKSWVWLHKRGRKCVPQANRDGTVASDGGRRGNGGSGPNSYLHPPGAWTIWLSLIICYKQRGTRWNRAVSLDEWPRAGK